jgi:hypothetical protein
MAPGAVRDVYQALLAVLALGFRRLVFVTAAAGIGGVIVRMADLAGNVACAAVIQGKGVIAQARGQPAYGRVAGRTVVAKEPPVEVRLQVAGDAPGG